MWRIGKSWFWVLVLGLGSGFSRAARPCGAVGTGERHDFQDFPELPRCIFDRISGFQDVFGWLLRGRIELRMSCFAGACARISRIGMGCLGLVPPPPAGAAALGSGSSSAVGSGQWAVDRDDYCDHTVARNLEGKSAALPFRRPVAKDNRQWQLEWVRDTRDTPCPHTLSPHLVSTPCLHTLSPHFVPTLCRKRKRKRQRCPRLGYFVLVLVLVLEPRYCRYCRNCRNCRREGQASACPRLRGRADARPSRCRGLGVFPGALRAASRDGVAPPVLARLCRSVPGTRRQPTTSDNGLHLADRRLIP